MTIYDFNLNLIYFNVLEFITGQTCDIHFQLYYILLSMKCILHPREGHIQKQDNRPLWSGKPPFRMGVCWLLAEEELCHTYIILFMANILLDTFLLCTVTDRNIAFFSVTSCYLLSFGILFVTPVDFLFTENIKGAIKG